MSKPVKWVLLLIPLLVVMVLIARPLLQSRDAQPSGPFRLEEATIADVHRAIQQGQITCRGLVQAYIDRARAYNGVERSAGHARTARRFRPHPAPCAPARR